MRVSASLVLASGLSVLSKESMSVTRPLITITPAPSTTAIAVAQAFIGHSIQHALDKYTTWFCGQGQIWSQDGNYARCCDSNQFAECGIATACLSTSLMVGLSSQKTWTCSGTGTQTLCVTGTIYPTIGATLGVTNVQCWSNWNGGNWNATRYIAITSYSAQATTVSAVTTTSIPSITGALYQASTLLPSAFVRFPNGSLQPSAIIGIAFGIPFAVVIFVFMYSICLLYKRRWQTYPPHNTEILVANLVVRSYFNELTPELSGKSRETELPDEQNQRPRVSQLNGQYRSGFINTDQPVLSSLEKVKYSTISLTIFYKLDKCLREFSTAYTSFIQNMRSRYVMQTRVDGQAQNPGEETATNLLDRQDISQESTTSQLWDLHPTINVPWVHHMVFMRLKNLARKIIQSKPLPHQQRVEWKCGCGEDLFADISNSSPGEFNRLSSILQSAGSQRQPKGGFFDTDILSNTPKTKKQHSISRILSRLSTESSGSSSMTPIVSVAPTSSSNFLGPADEAYLEVCINTGEYTKTLSEINLEGIRCDGELFKEIRSEYSRLRNFRFRFWLLKPSVVHFVKFTIQDPLRVGILQKPLSIPPQSEVDAKNYLYSPCPLQDDPPIPQNVFLHYLSCTSVEPTLAWLPRLPKKIDASILRFTGAINEGWGIHINEGPNWFAVGILNLCFMIISGIAAGLWKYFMNDFQGAFGFAGWVVAVVNAVLVAYVAKWSSCIG